MKIIAYLFYIGDEYSIYECPNFESHSHTAFAELCPHGEVDEKDLT